MYSEPHVLRKTHITWSVILARKLLPFTRAQLIKTVDRKYSNWLPEHSQIVFQMASTEGQF